jgi:hypothetical protein
MVRSTQALVERFVSEPWSSEESLRTGRALSSKIFATLWLAGVASLVASGFSVDGYKLHVERIPLPHPYPLTGVLFTSFALTLEFGLIYALLRPSTYARSWGRSLCATAVAAVASLASGLSLIHAPPYLFTHSLILLCLTVGLGVLFLASAAAAVHYRLTRVQS